jgi:phosphoglycolate phosphatase
MNSLTGYTIAFDLDGTLIETAGDIHRALGEVLSAEGLPPLPMAEVRKLVGGGARLLIQRALQLHGATRNDATLDRLMNDYIAAYAANIASLSHPFPGLDEALDELQGLGATLCVCTNKRTDLSVQLLGTLGMQHRFAAIVGGDAAPNRKPHPDHYIHAIRMAGGDPARSMMVGDSIYDVRTAKAAGAPVAVYAFGYTDTAPDLLGADAVFTHFTELPDLAVHLLLR